MTIKRDTWRTGRRTPFLESAATRKGRAAAFPLEEKEWKKSGENKKKRNGREQRTFTRKKNVYTPA